MWSRMICQTCIAVGLFISILSGTAHAGQIVFEKTPQGIAHVPQEIIVKFKPGTTHEGIRKLNFKHGSSILATSRRGGFMRLRISRGRDAKKLVRVYNRLPQVEYAELNTVCQAFMVPNDTHYSYQWHLQLINMESAWDVQTGNSGIAVAILDTGVAYENYTDWTGTYYLAPDLAGTSFVLGYDSINSDYHPNDDHKHGTHVTGTIAQTTNNSKGVAGIAHNCSVMPVKVLDSGGYGTATSLADGIYWAVDHGARVINMSLGWPSGFYPGQTLANAISYAYGQGVVLVAAAGNDGGNVVCYPAAFDEVIAVGATHSGDERASYSQYGEKLEVVAPGGDGADRNNDGYMDGVLQQTFSGSPSNFAYWFYTGTSMATPHVSGVAALLLSQDPTRTPVQIRQILHDSAVDLGPAGWDTEYGYGRIDASAALTPPPPNEPPVAVINGPATGTEDVAVAFDASASSDPEGDPLTYLWNFGDGNTSTAMNPIHTYTEGVVYIVTLTVNDGTQDSAPDTHSIDIAEVNDPPVADAGPDQTVTDNDGSGAEAVTLDGSGSNDPEGDPLTYNWTWSGGLASGSNPTVSLPVGIHTITLTVSDGEASATDEVLITVEKKPEPQPLSLTVITTNRNKELQTSFGKPRRIYVLVSVESGGGLVAGASVQVEVIDPNGVLVRQLQDTTNSDGEYFKSFKLSRWDPSGSYTINVSAQKEGYNPASGSTNFELLSW